MAKADTANHSRVTEAESFKKAAASYGKDATRSKAAALATLKRIGIVTNSGRLSSKYK